ncbi:MAG: restriction endonuclease subunit S [bacterium]|nr:restriction endonuclease subunit S [bacterium]
MTDLIDLNPRSLRTVQRILADHVPECEVRAYGSRARWEAKDYSDLDLAVAGDGPTDRGILGDLREAFEESDLPIRVEVVDWHTIDEAFRARIKPDSVVIQPSTVAAGKLMSGHVPTGWHQQELGEFAPFSYGRGLPKAQRSLNGEFRVYGSNGVVGFHDEPLTRGPTVIVGRKGTAGAVHYSPHPCWPIDTTFYVEGEDLTLQRYIYYALRSSNLSDMNSDSAVPGLNRSQAHAQSVLIPPVGEQREIALVLGALDDKIELNWRMSETLDETARALFRSWFVDFDPVRAKAEGRFSGLPPDLDALFPDAFEPSELGPIPAGWQIDSLSGIAKFTNGLALKRFPPAEDSWLPVIKIAEMRRGFTGRSFKASADIGEDFIVEDGDVLFSWFGSLDTVLWGHGRGALNQHLFKVTSSRVPRWFYWNWIREHLPEFRAIASDKATTMGHIQRHHLDEAMVIVPPAKLLESPDLLFSSLIERQVGSATVSRTLAALRDTLLPKLLSGELRVPTAGVA